jgi:hypothetical protein
MKSVGGMDFKRYFPISGLASFLNPPRSGLPTTPERRVRKMRKLFFVVVALAFAVSLPTKASVAKMAGPAKSVQQAQAEAPGGSAGPGKKAVAGKRTKRRQITGVVKEIDESAGTLTVQGRKGSVSLKAGEKGKLAKIHVGDKVLVNYTGDTASSITKVSGKTATTKEMVKKEAHTKMAEPAKKEMTPAATAPPAEKK